MIDVAILATLLGQSSADVFTYPAKAAAPVVVRASAEEMFLLADWLKQSHQDDQADRILNLLSEDPRPEVRNEALFRRSQMLHAKGSTSEAAVLLRRILDDQPNATRARLELAGMLQVMGDEQAALRQLRAVRSADLPPNVARFVDRITASLQASKPFGFQLEVAFAPDSNINRASKSDTLGTVFGDFQLDQQKHSGIGAALRGMAQARLDLGKEVQIVGRVSSEASLYRDKDFNDIVLDVAAGPEFRLHRTRLNLEAGVSQQWFGMKPYQRTLRLTGSATKPLDGVSLLRIDAGVRKSSFEVNQLQEGRGFSLRARYERSLSPELLVSASLGADRFKARDDAYSTRGWTASVAAYRDLGRMTLNASIDIGRLSADDRLSLLPVAREDKLTRFQIGSVFRQLTFRGFAPMTRLVIERNKSSIEFHDYKRTRTEFGVTRAF